MSDVLLFLTRNAGFLPVAAAVGALSDGVLGASGEFRLFYYNVVIIGTLIFNYFRLLLQLGRPFDWHPLSHLPTTVAFSRLGIAFALSVAYASDTKSARVAAVYLVYLAFLCASHDRQLYHYQQARWLRTAIDMLAAAVIFVAFSSREDISELSVLSFCVPIFVIARYEQTLRAAIAASLAMLFMISVSFYIGAVSFNLLRHLGPGFFLAVTNSKLLSGEYANAKDLVLAAALLAGIVVIYYTETNRRWRWTFDFRRYLDMWIQRRGRQLDEELLAFLAYYVNCEIVVAVKQLDQHEGAPLELVYACQQHSWPFLTGHEQIKQGASGSKYQGWQKNYLANDGDDYSGNVSRIWTRSIRGVQRRVRKPRGNAVRQVEARLWGTALTPAFAPAVWEFVHPYDREALREFQDILFQEFGLGEMRESAEMYPGFKLVALVGAKVGAWMVYFVNNFPPNYRITPRAFWEEGIERIEAFVHRLGE